MTRNNGIDLMSELGQRVGRTFYTLGRRLAFELVAVDRRGILVRPAATQTVRNIPIDQVQGAFEHLVKNRSIDLKGIRKFSEMNPVYVAALFADLPGINQSGYRPIMLRCSTVD